MKQQTELALWPLDVLYALGGILVNDDLKDFPWHPYLNGDPWDGKNGHVPGMPHHGMIGFLMQAGSKMGALALVGQDLAEEIRENKNLFVEMMEFWEAYAYPEP